jgi:hypothetical protein
MALEEKVYPGTAALPSAHLALWLLQMVPQRPWKVLFSALRPEHSFHLSGVPLSGSCPGILVSLVLVFTQAQPETSGTVIVPWPFPQEGTPGQAAAKAVEFLCAFTVMAIQSWLLLGKAPRADS